jgi:type IV pilus assembly protein PilE
MAALMKENAMTNGSPRRISAGFTLLEVMITVVIVGILASIALPSYNYFITRSRLTEATNTLSNMRTQMEKWFMDHRTYDDGTGKCGIEATAAPLISQYNGDSNNKFQMACTLGAGGSSYVLKATGTGAMGSFEYQINEQNAKKTNGAPGGWTVPSGSTCWVLRKDGSCS